MIDIKTTNVITICGMRGTGKTTYGEYLAGEEAKTGQPIMSFDPLDQLGGVQAIKRVVPKLNEPQEFEALCKEAWTIGNVTLLCEESELYLGEGMNLPIYTKNVVLRGRNRGIGLIANTRRIAMLSKTVFSLSDHVFIFRHFSPNDCKYLTSFVGGEWEAKIRGLANFHFIHFANGHAEEMEPLKLS